MSGRDEDGNAASESPQGSLEERFDEHLRRLGLADLYARPIVARLATLDDEGYPRVVPVWFEHDHGDLLVVARAAAGYVADIRRDPRVSVSIVDDRDADRRLLVRGRAELIGRPGPLSGAALELARRLGERYEGESGVAYIERSRTWPRVVVRIVAERVTGWGSPDWHPRYRGEGHEEE